MVRKLRIVAALVMFLGITGIVLGSVFVALGIDKENMLRDEMRIEKVTYLLPEDEVAAGNVVDTAEEADQVADTVREHRRGIAPTYEELLGEGRYDPTNPSHLSYNQAMNMENYLYLAVLGFGVTQVVIGAGVFMLITGIAIVAVGIVLFQITGRTSVNKTKPEA